MTAFVRFGTRAQASPATTISPAKPTVNTLGGVLLCGVETKNNDVHSCSTPGWSKLNQQNSGAGLTASLWIAAEGAAAPTFTWTNSVACSAQIAYYNDLNAPLDPTVSALSTSSGSSNPHTSTAIVSSRDNSLGVYFDIAAANTAIAAPAGWTEDADAGSATDGGRTAFGNKPLATAGTSSGAISITGAAAAWVQWQLEIRQLPASGGDLSKIEAGAWVDVNNALAITKIEEGAWLDAGALGISKIGTGAWLDAGALGVTKIEGGAWLDLVPVVTSNRRMSLM